MCVGYGPKLGPGATTTEPIVVRPGADVDPDALGRRLVEFGYRREELVEQIMQRQSEQKGQRYAAGILDIVEDFVASARYRDIAVETRRLESKAHPIRLPGM